MGLRDEWFIQNAAQSAHNNFCKVQWKRGKKIITTMKAFSGKCGILQQQNPPWPFGAILLNKVSWFQIGTFLWATVPNQPFCYGKVSFSTKFVTLSIFYFLLDLLYLEVVTGHAHFMGNNLCVVSWGFLGNGEILTRK